MTSQNIVKLLKTKNKEEFLKVAKEKWQITYRGTVKQLTEGFLSQTTEAKIYCRTSLRC